MADDRIKKYWSSEMEALINTYEQFQELIPSATRAGAAHVGEDGRYVEFLIREYLNKYLPKDLEVLTGFILRPAVACGNNDRSRKKDEHEISSQLDIIVYDTAHYPIYQRFGDSVIVPPEGVVAVISVKKHLRLEDIEHEVEVLGNIGRLCVHKNAMDKKARSPFTALVTIKDKINEKRTRKLSAEQMAKKVYDKLEGSYSKKKTLFYPDMVDFVGSLSEWGLYKERPNKRKEAKYMFFEYNDKQYYLGFQLILQNILSVYYDNLSMLITRPGFTDNSFESYSACWGPIEYRAEEVSRS